MSKEEKSDGGTGAANTTPDSPRARIVRDLEAKTSEESMIRYRAVADRLQSCLDLFSSRLSALPKGERFAAPVGKSTDPGDKFRNDMRTYALGCFVALGRDVGLLPIELYGQGKGRTLLAELHPMHHMTVLAASEKFDALRRDGSEVGEAVRLRFDIILGSALAEVDHALARLRKAAA
jgi:hypothetical protein